MKTIARIVLPFVFFCGLFIALGCGPNKPAPADDAAAQEKWKKEKEEMIEKTKKEGGGKIFQKKSK